jgi:AcrR family transcriptional regulator
VIGMPDAVSLRERQRARTRAEILDAVVAVVAGDAVSGPVIDEIAARAGVSRATLYAHYPGGIDELVSAAYTRAGEEFLRRVAERQEAATDWRGRIEAHAAAMLDLAADGGLGRFYNVAAERMPAATSVRGAGSRASYAAIAHELETARRDGAIAGSAADARETAHLLTAAVHVVGVRAADSLAAGRASRRAFRALLDGLAPGS